MAAAGGAADVAGRARNFRCPARTPYTGWVTRRFALPKLHATALLAVGILSMGCAALSGPAPRSPGAGDDAPRVGADTTAFSVEEHERIAAVDPWVTQAAARHDLDPDLIRGVIWVESRYVARAKSPAGARGLMQLMPPTASALAQKLGMAHPNPYDPEFNIAAGSLYLREMIARYDGDIALGLSAYNAGPGNVDKWRAQGLPPRNREYVDLVLDAKARFEAAYHTPQGRPTDTQLAKASAPDRRPPVVIPEPPQRADITEDGIVVRHDLDRVESDYKPVVEDPPMGETPLPPRGDQTQRPRVRPEPTPPAAGDAAEPEVGLGVLPSVTP